jgi:hypothetical protein
MVYTEGNALRRFLIAPAGFPAKRSYLSLNKTFNIADNLWLDGYSSAYPSG